MKRPAIIARRVLLAGNPNVGKSSLFNALTGAHQHTGNWTGKTVEGAVGRYRAENGVQVELVDLPGAYSMTAYSPEEGVARDAVAFEQADAVCVVCDACNLQRGLLFTLQVMELAPRVVLCLNMWDRAQKQGVQIDTQALSRGLGVPVITTAAHRKRTVKALGRLMAQPVAPHPPAVVYSPPLERELTLLAPLLPAGPADRRGAAIKLLEQDEAYRQAYADRWGPPPTAGAIEALAMQGISARLAARQIEAARRQKADALFAAAVTGRRKRPAVTRLDRLLAGKWSGLPVMPLLLLLVFWLTIFASQGPSDALLGLLFAGEAPLAARLAAWGVPGWLVGMLAHGVWRVTAFVVAVMLPPMAIFFPLFTLLEDAGLLPRIAFRLDRHFQACRSCGKQALTMCMGFGCNAAGVTGCRIISSRRERLIAVLTNALVPCNGRFPTLITLIGLFFVTAPAGPLASLATAGWLTLAVVLCVAVTLLCSRLLAVTVLRGEPSFFALELPPLRMPPVGRVLVRSLRERIVFVLGRAAAVAAPAGGVIWLLANWRPGGVPLLQTLAGALEPVGDFLGMDGVILLAFLLGLPANEIVLPLLLTIYSGSGTLVGEAGLETLRTTLTAHGWNRATALCVLLFCLFHFPCSTTLWTVYKETGSARWTALAAVLPAAVGCGLCAGIHALLG